MCGATPVPQHQATLYCIDLLAVNLALHKLPQLQLGKAAATVAVRLVPHLSGDALPAALLSCHGLMSERGSL
jgi:hypothetical protein